MTNEHPKQETIYHLGSEPDSHILETPGEIAAYYDNLYRRRPDVWGIGFPSDEVTHMRRYLSGGSALDIGAGEGRNSLFLAGRKFSVDAIDLSEVGLAHLRARAKKFGVAPNIRTICMDVRSFRPDRVYDTAVSTFTLNHLTRSDALALIATMKKSVRPGGLNVISLFTEHGDEGAKNKDKRFYPAAGELRAAYERDGWEILEYDESEVPLTIRERAGGSPMTNVRAALIARKPETGEAREQTGERAGSEQAETSL